MKPKRIRLYSTIAGAGVLLALACRLDFLGQDIPSSYWTALRFCVVIWFIVALWHIGRMPLLAIPAIILLYLFPFVFTDIQRAGIPNEGPLVDFLRENDVVGASVALTANGRIYFAGYGGTNKLGAKPSADTPYQIASVTKIFTGHVLSDNFDPKLVPLATHTSGLPDLTEAPSFFPLFVRHPLSFYDHYTDSHLDRDVAHFASSHRLSPREAKTWRYSNLGFCLLGRELAMSRRRFKGVSFTRPADAALAYNAAGVRTPLWGPGACHGAGGLYASATALLDFARQPSGAKRLHFDDGVRQMGLGWMYDKGIWYHSGSTFGNSAFVAHEPTSDTAVVILVSGVVRDIDSFGLRYVRGILAGNAAGPGRE